MGTWATSVSRSWLRAADAGRTPNRASLLSFQVESAADLAAIRTQVRERLAEQLGGAEREALAVALTEVVGRLLLVAATPLDGWLDGAPQTAAHVRGELVRSRAEAQQVLRWDERTFGGLLLSDACCRTAVDFEPLGAVVVHVRVSG